MFNNQIFEIGKRELLRKEHNELMNKEKNCLKCQKQLSDNGHIKYGKNKTIINVAQPEVVFVFCCRKCKENYIKDIQKSEKERKDVI